ncbi:MAG: hypothetical protein WCO13_08830 [Bacteroidota bacterium]
MQNVILLEPHGGLANRMRVIVSGLWLAGKLNKKIKLIWNLNSDLNCSFEELFEAIPNIECIEKKKALFMFRSTFQKPLLKRLIIKCINVLVSGKYVVFEDRTVKMIMNKEIDIVALGKSNKTLYFMTCEEFGDNHSEYKYFIPKPDIQQKIDRQCNQFNSKTIGVHIRRTDHEIAIKLSPTELFIQRINEDLAKDPEINYFLSTDDAATEIQFKMLFGDKIMCTEKEFSQNSSYAIKNALVDFYCLANTNKIYGSSSSSFSYIAARINGIKIENLKYN